MNPSGGGRRGKQMRGAATAAALLFGALAPALAAGPAGASFAKPVSEDRTMREGESQFVNLYYSWPPQDLEIDLTWNSTVPIDVWYMDRAQFDKFWAGEPFEFDIAQKGRNGTIRTNVSADRQNAAHGSMYLVYENGPRGDTAPPNGTVVSVHVEGKLWSPDPVYAGGDQGTPLWITALELSFFLIPVAIVATVVVRRVQRKERREKIRQELAAGNVVGGGAVVAPETVRPEPLPPPPPPPPAYAPPPYGQPAYYGQPVYAPAPPPAAFCGGCGAPRTSASGFCGHCGARL